MIGYEKAPTSISSFDLELTYKINEIVIAMQIFALMKIHLRIWTVNCQPFCLNFNVLNVVSYIWLQTTHKKHNICQSGF